MDTLPQIQPSVRLRGAPKGSRWRWAPGPPTLPAERFVAYTAGLFDGEGCLLPAHTPSMVYGLQLTQSEANKGFAVLTRIQTAWGIGLIYREPASGHSGPRCVWRVNRKTHVAFFLRAIVEDLIIKEDAAREAIDSLARRGF